ncbi:MAG: DUF971 domain-containing protein, partial [Proteobacteria bacterium]
LEIKFPNQLTVDLSAELLRVLSPSAEVQGHGPGQEVLQTGKADVEITAIEPVGHYAVQISFDDGHSSGLYTWAYLAHLASEKQTLWQRYLRKLEDAGASRDPSTDIVRIMN